MPALYCTSGVSADCKTFAVLDLCGRSYFLDRNRDLSIFRDVSNQRREYPMVFCLRRFPGRNYYMVLYSKINKKVVDKINKTR